MSICRSTCLLIDLSLYLATHLCRKMHLCRSSSNLPHLPSFLKMLQNPHVSVTFQWMHNPRHLPYETTSERPKCLRDPQFLTLLTSKCASRHNGVHFFVISTSKTAPRPSVFNTFYFQICFAPQRRALFQHLDFQKWSDAEVLCTFSLRNRLRATTACNFSSLISQMSPHPPL